MWHWWVREADQEGQSGQHDLRFLASKSAHSLALLPSSTTVVMECDCTRAEAEDMHKAIVGAGGKSRLLRMPASHSWGGNHIFEYDEGRRAFDDVLLPLLSAAKV